MTVTPKTGLKLQPLSVQINCDATLFYPCHQTTEIATFTQFLNINNNYSFIPRLFSYTGIGWCSVFFTNKNQTKCPGSEDADNEVYCQHDYLQWCHGTQFAWRLFSPSLCCAYFIRMKTSVLNRQMKVRTRVFLNRNLFWYTSRNITS